MVGFDQQCRIQEGSRLHGTAGRPGARRRWYPIHHGFSVDRVARPTDNKVAAHELSSLANPFKTAIPSFIGVVDKGLVSVGAVAAPIFPSLVMPLARKRLRQW